MLNIFVKYKNASRQEPLPGGILLFATKSLEIPGTHFIDLGRVKDWVGTLDTGPLAWESSALTTRPLLYNNTLRTSPKPKMIVLNFPILISKWY